MTRNLDPCIIFSFSKKECEAHAISLKGMDFNDEAEKDLVEQVYLNGIDALSEDDKKLPQVSNTPSCAYRTGTILINRTMSDNGLLTLAVW
jgi:superfamily II RNA helicase